MTTTTADNAAAAAAAAAAMEAYVKQAWQVGGDSTGVEAGAGGPAGGQLLLLIGIAAVMGLGKGGVPGFATIATAATVATAPLHIPGGLQLAVALQVPVLCIMDVAAAYLHRDALDMPTVLLLLPCSFVGMIFGQGLDRYVLTDASARILVGIILLTLLFIRVDWQPVAECLFPQAMERRRRRRIVKQHELLPTTLSSSSSSCSSFRDNGASSSGPTSSSSSSTSSSSTRRQSSLWKQRDFIWASVVGIVGGAATMLTNSMGPILNVYLLSVRQLSPSAYIGTRAMFFCAVNVFGKLPLRLFYSQTLGCSMMPLAGLLGAVSIVGVYGAKPIMLSMSERNFVLLELSVVAFAGVRLLWMGLFG